MNFDLIKESGKEEYRFHLVEGEVKVLSSEVFPDKESCTDAIRDLINIGEQEGSYQTVGGENGATLRIVHDDVTLAQSANMSQQAVDALRDRLRARFAEAGKFEVNYITRTITKRKASFTNDRYDFAYTSNGTAEDIVLYKKGDYYHYLFTDGEGKPYLYGQQTKTRTTRHERIAYILEAGGDPARYRVVKAGKEYYFILKSKGGKEMARSRLYARRKDAKAGMAAILDRMEAFGAIYATKKQVISRKAGKREGMDEYNFSRASTSGKLGFETYHDTDRKSYHFQFNDEAGAAFAYGQAYSSKKARDNGIRSIIRNAGFERRYIRKQEGDSHYFTLRAGNNQEIIRSRMYPTAAAVEAGILLLQSKALDFAAAYGLSKETILAKIVTERETFTLTREYSK